MTFHFIFLLLVNGSSFFFLVFLQFSILSTIDNAPREHLVENIALFFYLHFGHFGNGGHYSTFIFFDGANATTENGI